MVEQVRPNTGKLVNEVYSHTLERLARPDARKLQQVRRSDRSAAENDFALGQRFRVLARFARKAIRDASSAPALDKDARHERPRDHGEVGAASGGLQIAVHDAEAPPSPL